MAFVSVSFASILIGLITQVLDAGYKCYCLGVHRREEMPYESLFDGFTFAGKVIGWYLIVFVIVGVYEGVILALMPDSFLGIMLGSLILTVLTGVVDIYLTPYFALSDCGFYLRATAPEEPPRQDRSSYTPEF